LWTFWALSNFKLNVLTFFKSLKAISLNRAVMNEDVLSGRPQLLNKSIPL